MATNNSTSLSIAEKEDVKVVAWRNKVEQTKKCDVLRELHKLDIQIQAMTREKGTHLYSKRSEFRKDYCLLEEHEVKLNEEKKAEKIRLQQQVEKISSMVKRFRRELKDVKPTPEFVEKLKVIMEDIEATINNFKEQERHKFEELLSEERTTSQELLALEKRFEAWSRMADAAIPTDRMPPIKPPSSARDVIRDLPSEVAAYEKFLQQTGGIRGGWDEYDHQTFLKIRNRCKGRPGFIQQLAPTLPTQSEEEIRNHEMWYQEYLFLNELKKDAIKKWRTQKEEDKEIVIARAEDDSSDEEDDSKVKLKDVIEQEKQERFERLSSWKMQKDLERAQEEERKLNEEIKKMKKQEEERKRQIEVKGRADVYKQQKQEERELLEQQQAFWEQNELERRSQLSARNRTRFRDRDQRALDEKLAKERSKEEEKKEKQIRLEKTKEQVQAPRDPDRLLRPTQGWTQRTKDPAPSGGGQVLHLPHRAVPSWRQGP